jgi:hypothetical protein
MCGWEREKPYHLCWRKLAVYSVLTDGGKGCSNVEKNSIMLDGKAGDGSVVVAKHLEVNIADKATYE